MVTRKSRSEIERMRRAGRIVAEVLDIIGAEIAPGVSTAHLDELAEAHIRRSGAIPSFKGYPGANPRRPFPASVCISLDQEIVHGIPGERMLKEGQIVSVDAGAILDGWHGDAARTFFVGEPPQQIRDLIAATEAAMLAGIAAAIRVWRFTRDGIRVTARIMGHKVIKIHPHTTTSSDNEDQFLPIVTFHDEKGIFREITLSTERPTKVKGVRDDEIRIIYAKGDPKKAKVDDWALLWISTPRTPAAASCAATNEGMVAGSRAVKPHMVEPPNRNMSRLEVASPGGDCTVCR